MFVVPGSQRQRWVGSKSPTADRRHCRAEAGKTLCPAEMVTHVVDVTDAACVEPVLRWRIQLFLSCARYFNPHEHEVDQG